MLLREAEAEALGEAEPAELLLRLREPLPLELLDCVLEELLQVEALAEPLVEGEPEKEELSELVLQAVEEVLGLTVALLLLEPVELTLGLPEAVMDWLRVALPEADLEAEGEPEREAVLQEDTEAE